MSDGTVPGKPPHRWHSWGGTITWSSYANKVQATVYSQQPETWGNAFMEELRLCLWKQTTEDSANARNEGLLCPPPHVRPQLTLRSGASKLYKISKQLNQIRVKGTHQTTTARCRVGIKESSILWAWTKYDNHSSCVFVCWSACDEEQALWHVNALPYAHIWACLGIKAKGEGEGEGEEEGRKYSIGFTTAWGRDSTSEL